MTLRAKAEAAALEVAEYAWGKQGEVDTDWLASEIIKIAREFAEKALRGIYDVDSYDDDDPRARGGWRPKAEYEGTRNIESRHYRQGFNEAIAAAIAAAEGDE